MFLQYANIQSSAEYVVFCKKDIYINICMETIID